MTASQSVTNPAAPAAGGAMKSVARGGALNLIGAVVYGASNFALLVVLTREMGADAAGVVIVSIAIFNISSKLAELGCSTGLIRFISRRRAAEQTELLPRTYVVALVPVLIGSMLVAAGLIAAAPWLADVFAGDTGDTDVGGTVRAMAAFLPFAAVYSVIVQATRGFDSMVPQVSIEKIGRASLLPVLAYVGIQVGLSPAGVAVLWAATTVVALIPASIALYRMTRQVVPASAQTVEPWGDVGRDYWAFTGPRAVGQFAEVLVNWMDTIIVGALITTAAAGIYGAGTRLLLPGLFVAEAIMQVVGPRVSGMVTKHDYPAARELVQTATGWQVALLWPAYLVMFAFAPVLLKVFGDEVVAATEPLRVLSVGILVASLFGPSMSVIMMSGRSIIAMFDTLLLVVINIAGNLIFVPRYGLTAAGAVWAVTMVVAGVVPAIQSERGLGLMTFGRPAITAASISAATFGVAVGGAWAVFGAAVSGLAVAVVVGCPLYFGAVFRYRDHLGLTELRRDRNPSMPPDRVASAQTTNSVGNQ